MYFVSLHGHATSCWPGSSGAPTVCTAGTKKPSSPIASSAALPMRVVIFIEITTYGESGLSTPRAEIGEPSGPMQKGTTYIVRPRMQPSNSGRSVARISSGAIQLLVGPASSLLREQMKVRSSTRATSVGSDQARYELGRLTGSRRRNVPASTSSWQRRSYSSWLPSHQYTESGLHRATMSATHAISFALRTYAGAFRVSPF